MSTKRMIEQLVFVDAPELNLTNHVSGTLWEAKLDLRFKLDGEFTKTSPSRRVSCSTPVPLCRTFRCLHRFPVLPLLVPSNMSEIYCRNGNKSKIEIATGFFKATFIVSRVKSITNFHYSNAHCAFKG